MSRWHLVPPGKAKSLCLGFTLEGSGLVDEFHGKSPPGLVCVKCRSALTLFPQAG